MSLPPCLLHWVSTIPIVIFAWISQDYTVPSPRRTKSPLGRGRNTGFIVSPPPLVWSGQDTVDMNECSCSLQQHYWSPHQFQCHTNKVISLHPTCLNSDNKKPPVHQISLCCWTFHSTLLKLSLWSCTASITGHLQSHDCYSITSRSSFIGPVFAYHVFFAMSFPIIWPWEVYPFLTSFHPKSFNCPLLRDCLSHLWVDSEFGLCSFW